MRKRGARGVVAAGRKFLRGVNGIYKLTVFLGLAAAFAAWGVDCVVERAALPTGAPDPAGTDGARELKWDSGYGSWWVCWRFGRDTWVGNDFDISTIAGYRAIQAIKVQSRNQWPNMGWDGFYLGVYNFSGGIPSSLLWGPKFVVPSGATGWKVFSVNWTLPSGTHKFLAAWEQYYDYYNCDPLLIDSNPNFLGHSWLHYQGRWMPFEYNYISPYRNVMLRVIVNNSTPNVESASAGRVKALYY